MKITEHNVVSVTNGKAIQLDSGTWNRNITIIYKENEYSDEVCSFELSIFSENKDSLTVKNSRKR